ncbi:MAG TPA: class I SAM-dependent methyltransferase [Acidimicrobiia bacterium]|nr:class I SAM-dependent methyltransferase [Acidimicrobiia bacterium]
MAERGSPGIDLERLASGYGYRAAGTGDRNRAEIACRAANIGVGDLAVDVGGGRGAHALVFAGSGATAVVVDRSPAMAAHSASVGLIAVVADGERLPLRDQIAGLVYLHLSIHHGDPESMLREATRIVRPGGVVWVWTLAPSHVRASFLTRWFPSVGPIDERRFPDPAELARIMIGTGLEPLASMAEEEQIVRTAGSWVDAVRSGFVSTLQLISPEELEEGLARFHEAHPNPSEEISYSLAYRSVSGFRPSLVS